MLWHGACYTLSQSLFRLCLPVPLGSPGRNIAVSSISMRLNLTGIRDDSLV